MSAAPAGVSPTFWSLVTAEPLGELTVLDVGTGTGRVALALAPLARHVVGGTGTSGPSTRRVGGPPRPASSTSSTS